MTKLNLKFTIYIFLLKNFRNDRSNSYVELINAVSRTIQARQTT